MEANLKLTKLTVQEMLDRPEQAYNPSIWKAWVLRYAKCKQIQFYVVEKSKESGYDYARFFCSYIASGIYLFNQFSAFSACLSNAGFCKVQIDENGNVNKFLFKDSSGKEGYAENCKANRESFKQLTSLGIMVSTCI